MELMAESTAEFTVCCASPGNDLLPLILAMLIDHLDLNDFGNLAYRQQCNRSQAQICCLVSKMWNQSARKVPSFWSHLIGNPRKPSGTRMVWSNRILHDAPVVVDSVVNRVVFFWYRSIFTTTKWKADRNKIFLAIFDEGKSAHHRTISSMSSLADYLQWMDTDERPEFSIVDFLNPVRVSKGQYVGLIFNIEASVEDLYKQRETFPVMYFMTPKDKFSEDKESNESEPQAEKHVMKDCPVLFDYNATTDEFLPDTASHSGWCAILTARFE